jgi:hypothetical protein
MSFFINYIKVPFVTAVNTFSLSDNFLYSVNLTGFYQQLQFGNDNFDIYSTGGGQFTQLFFSGSGYWNGSGRTISNSYYFYDSFDNYSTGLISGFGVTGNGLSGFMANETGLNSGTFTSGYSTNLALFTGYIIWSGYL